MENYKEINLFLCDISGTYTGSSDCREFEVNRFAENLAKIKETDGLDNLSFGFISTNSMDDVKEKLSEIEPYLVAHGIGVGPQFSSKHILEDGVRKRFTIGKQMQIFFYAKDHQIGHLYYADDMVTFHNMVRYILGKKLPTIVPTQFVLGDESHNVTELGMSTEKKGISALNDLLEAYCIGKTEDHSLNKQLH